VIAGDIARVATAKVLGWVVAIIGVVLAFMSAYNRGKSAARVETAEATAAATTRMTQAATSAPTEKDDVAKDARSGRF
jgi:hypothetical protein